MTPEELQKQNMKLHKLMFGILDKKRRGYSTRLTGTVSCRNCRYNDLPEMMVKRDKWHYCPECAEKIDKTNNK